jgi:hypothetical protein
LQATFQIWEVCFQFWKGHFKFASEHSTFGRGPSKVEIDHSHFEGDLSSHFEGDLRNLQADLHIF